MKKSNEKGALCIDKRNVWEYSKYKVYLCKIWDIV